MLVVAQDTFGRADQSGLGTSSDGETYSTVFGTGTLSITNQAAQLASPIGGTGILLGKGTLNQPDILVKFTPSATDVYMGPIFAWVDSNNYCYVEIVNLAMRLYKVVGGVATQVATSAVAISGGSTYWCHLSVLGTTAKVRMWADGANEPNTWPTSASDAKFSLLGQYGLRAYLSSGGETAKFGRITVSAIPSTYYVSISGNDSNSGSQAQPLLTLQQALNVMQAGDALYVQDGTYTQPDGSQLTSNAFGTPLAPIFYQPVNKYGALILSSSTTSVWLNNGDWARFGAFELTSLDPTTREGLLNQGSHVQFLATKAHDIRAIGNAGNGGAGLNHGNYLASDNDTLGCIAYACGSGTDRNVHGIYHASLRGNIDNNISIGNSGWGIHMWHGANNVGVFNNLVFNNVTGGVVTGAVNGEGSGINDNTIVANNIIIYNGLTSPLPAGGLYETGSTGTHNQYLNNVVYGNANVSGTNSQISLQHGLHDQNTINANPLLAGIAQGNYHLSALSPCIAAGQISGAPTTDFDGDLRGASIDIGPYIHGPLDDNSLGIVRQGGTDMQQGGLALVQEQKIYYMTPRRGSTIGQDVQRFRRWLRI